MSSTHVQTKQGLLSKTKASDWKNLHKYYLEVKSLVGVAKYAGSKPETIKKYFIKFGFRLLDKKEVNENNNKIRKENSLKKYGVESPNQLQDVKDKKKRVCLDKYGVENPNQLQDVKDKKKQTCLERYGVDCPSKNKEVVEKFKQTCLDKYGVNNPSKSNEVRDRVRKTNIDRYGVDCSLKSKEIREKGKKTCLDKYGVENPYQMKKVIDKVKKTNMDRYGVDNVFKSKTFQYNLKQFFTKKYGVDNPRKCRFIIDKISVKTAEALLRKGEKSWEIQLENIGYKLLEKYVGTRKCNTGVNTWITYKMKHLECCHEFEDYLCGVPRCPKCYPPLKSHMELFFKNFIEDMGYVVLSGSRNIISPLELDMYIPELNIAFEYNGSYWHSGIHKNRDYHKKKSELCLEKGIKLYHIWEYDNIEIVKSKIKQILHKTPTNSRLFARDLIVRKLTYSEESYFSLHHLHGYAPSSFSLGLVGKEDNIECSMSFILRNDNLMELSRFVNKRDQTVVGGFSKLLKHSIKYIKENYPQINKIVTYAYRDWTPDYKDSVYFKNGFDFVKATSPSLGYINLKNNTYYNRQRFMKHKLRVLFPDTFKQDLTEFQNLAIQHIIPVYNSGNWKFELNI